MGDLRAATSMRVSAAAEASATAIPADVDARAGIVAASLRILHILRAPVGGLFRHVLDVARGQAARGHQVGLIVDSMTCGARADAALGDLAPYLALGLQRVAIPRELNSFDVRALRLIARRIKHIAPDILHGHGAKAAALARLAPGAANAVRVYTPHGGTLVYHPGTLRGRFYRSLEWLLRWQTDLFLFESSYAADRFRVEIGPPGALVRVVRNGVGDDDFVPVASRPDATDIVCVGELRTLKGIDLLIEALAALKQSGRAVSVTIAGEGPDSAEFKALAQRLGLTEQVHFVGHRAAREAFAMGRVLVVPSRAESLPYIVLEAIAAGMPVVATRVGGIPEIFGPQSTHLIAPDNVAALVGAIAAAVDDREQLEHIARAVSLRVRKEFSSAAMVEGGLAAYREAVAMKKLARFT